MSSIVTPDWVKDAVFYQIFPDRFARSARLAPTKPHNLEPWDSPPTAHGYKGGDLLGVVEHLDHIEALGVNALYFTPIFQSASNHRYHTHDYYRVDPLLGGNEAFARLLSEAHRRGLRVALDGVFNHASRGFFYFNDILENGAASPYRDWFTVTHFPPNAYDLTRPPDYAAWWGLHALPKFNTEQPQVREYLMQVAEHWVRQGIDGWRLDVPQEIHTPGFWEEFRRRVKAINREAYIVGEVWDEAVPYLRGDRFDGVMNYQFAEIALGFAGGPRVIARLAEGKGYRPQQPLTAPQFAERVERLLSLYPWEIQLAQMNLLDSHDTARAITLCGGDEASVRLATLLLLTFPGAPCIFAGDEIGLEGGVPDPDARRAFPWEREDLWRHGMLETHRQLIALRRAHAALRRGTFHALLADDMAYAFARRLDDEVLVVVVNAGDHPQAVTLAAGDLLPEGAWLRTLWQPLGGPPGALAAVTAGGQVVDGRVSLEVRERSGVVLGWNA